MYNWIKKRCLIKFQEVKSCIAYQIKSHHPANKATKAIFYIGQFRAVLGENNPIVKH